MKPSALPTQNSGQAYYESPPPGYSPPNAAPPPPPGLHGSSHQESQQQPMIIYASTAPVQFGPYPMRYTCPNCDAHVMTETHSTAGALTYILSGALCLIAGCLLCCLVPCCIRECKDIEHRCPNCHHKLGLFKRI